MRVLVSVPVPIPEEDTVKGRLFKRLASVVLFPLILLLAACQSSGPAVGANPIRIGMIVPLTSGVASAAQSVVNGAQLAADEISGEKGIRGRRLKLVILDDHGNAQEAARLVEQLAGEEVVGIIGPVTDATTIAAAGAAERFQVALISPGATATLPYGGHFLFRTALPARTQAAAIASYLVENLGIRTIAVAHDSNEYGTMVARAFEESVKARGAAVTSRRLYRDGDTDFSRHVHGVLAERARALFLAGYPDEGTLLLRQMRALHPRLIIAGSDALYSEDTLAWGGSAADGLYAPASFVADTTLPIVKNFVTKYRQRFGRVPDHFAAQAYDAVRLLAQATRAAGPDRRKVRDALAAIRRFPGVTGELSFDRWGEVARDVTIVRVKGGVFVPTGRP
jgi:branched-chain amino acid transport system substrate-binding protein